MSIFPVEERFRLSDNFIHQFKWNQPDWGPLGYITYKRTYARIIPGTNRTEEFWETLRRVVEGCYTIQMNHCKRYRLPWNAKKAQHSAQEMHRLMWNFKFLPPGRGLWMMGTDYVFERGSAALNNCAFVSTEDIAFEKAEPFTFLMDLSMLGVGCAFDTKGAGKITIVEPKINQSLVYQAEDSKEGWVDTIRVLLNSYFGKGARPKAFDLSQIRPEGAPVKTFGGVCPGPAPLQKCINEVDCLLSGLTDQQLGSTGIVDLMNIIGKCVVSGGIRRCLPEGTMVHTRRGLIPIEDVTTLDHVVTTDGFKRVVETVNQGEQEVVTVKTQIGDFECTPTHRLKVFDGEFDKFTFRRAKDLKEGDLLVFCRQRPETGSDVLPKVDREGDIPANSLPFMPPSFSENFSWLLGNILGDGYIGSKAVSIVSHIQDVFTVGRTTIAFSELGLTPRFKLTKPEDLSGEYVRIRVYNIAFAKYLRQFKKANEDLHVPEFIYRAKRSLREAFLAGIFDADGTCKSRPLKAVTTKYKSFAEELGMLWASVGVATRISEYKDKRLGQVYYDLTISGEYHYHRAFEILQRWSCKFDKTRDYSSKSNTDYSFPTEWVRNHSDCTEKRQQTIRRYGDSIGEAMVNRLMGVDLGVTPIKVNSVETETRVVNTYDLSIEGNHEFVIWKGIVSHNTAELALGQHDDNEYVSMKDPKKFPEEMKQWRWASNNSIEASEGMDYATLAKQTAENGEPGYVWLDNCRHYGRLKDGWGDHDIRAVGVNPCGEQTLESYEVCVHGDTYIHYRKGCCPIRNLVGKEVEIWNGKKWSKVTPRQTHSSTTFMKVLVDDGSFLLATPEHKWIVVGKDDPVMTKDLQPHMVLPQFRLGQITGRSIRNARELGRSFARCYRTLNDVPEEIYEGNERSIRDFLDGWMMEMGAKNNRDGVRIFYEITDRGRVFQRLARRINMNVLLSSAFERHICAIEIHPKKVQQRVLAIREMKGEAAAYCFTEDELHQGVFENVLTKQCNLVETFPSRHETYNEYAHTLKFAYLYAKTVTLVPTHNERTNQIISRNRRIGLSQSGIIESFQRHGRREHFKWCDAGYHEIRRLDRKYSEWLGIPHSIKVTTVKPSGSISLLPGVTPGIHYPHSKFYYRTIRIDKTSPLLDYLKDAGYRIEKSVAEDSTYVVYFPVQEHNFERSKNEITIWEQMENAAQMQYYWADNQVSITVTFNPETESLQIGKALEMFETRLKVVSFLPMFDHKYAQAPYQEITEAEYLEASSQLSRLKTARFDTHEEEEKFCTGEACLIRSSHEVSETEK